MTGGPREGLFAAACLWLVGLHPKTYRYAAKRSAMKSFAFDCESWPRNGGGSAIGVLV